MSLQTLSWYDIFSESMTRRHGLQTMTVLHNHGRKLDKLQIIQKIKIKNKKMKTVHKYKKTEQKRNKNWGKNGNLHEMSQK